MAYMRGGRGAEKGRKKRGAMLSADPGALATRACFVRVPTVVVGREYGKGEENSVWLLCVVALNVRLRHGVLVVVGSPWEKGEGGRGSSLLGGVDAGQ